MTNELEDSELIHEFVREGREMLDNAELKLTALGSGQTMPADVINAVFRLFHSIKGSSGFLNFRNITLVTHEAETLLDLFRKGKVPFAGEYTVLLCQVCDFIRHVLDGVETTLKDFGFEGEAGKMVASLNESIACAVAAGALALEQQMASKTNVQPGQPDAMGMPPVLQVQPGIIGESPVFDSISPVHADAHEYTSEPGPGKADASSLRKLDVRVDVKKLDLLNNLVAELIIASSMVTKNRGLKGAVLADFECAAHHLGIVVTQLQEVSMALRTMQAAFAFRKMVRLAHDLAAKSGKSVDIQLLGEETEVDNNVFDLIGYPLMHLVRNAIDHGLESPEERRVAGKPEIGVITLEARRQAGEVWILIRDDGRGLDRAGILAKGIERGLVHGNGRGMSDDEVYALAFAPGLSTAKSVTDVSGRGVGLDVVRENMAKLNGRVQIESRKGQGLTVILQIPISAPLRESSSSP